jgi:hypothetical protein
MSLDVTPPDPPPLSDRDPDSYDDVSVAADANYRREELASLLADGAWEESFEQWAAETSVGPREWAVVTDLGLIEEFDFFWDDFADRVGYHAPGVPESWKEQDLHPNLDSWRHVSTINAGLAELGSVVCAVLKESYVTWEASYEPPDDLPDL